MKHIFNSDFKNLDSLTNGFYQIEYKQAYLKKDNTNIFIYSYDTCILQLDTKNKTIWNNQNKYSQTTSKQKNQILKMLSNLINDFFMVFVKPIHKQNGYFTILKLDSLAVV